MAAEFGSFAVGAEPTVDEEARACDPCRLGVVRQKRHRLGDVVRRADPAERTRRRLRRLDARNVELVGIRRRPDRPGQTAFTRMPCGPSSSAMPLTSPTSPAFEAE